MMVYRLLVVLVIFSAAEISAGPCEAAEILSPGGLGPARIGMTLGELRAALHGPLRLAYPRDSDNKRCFYAVPAGRTSGVSYMIVDGRLKRIDILPGTASHAVRSAKGIGLGSTEDRVRRIYGARLTIKTNAYDQSQHELVVTSQGGSSGLLFETDGHRVIWMLAGDNPELGYIEGCE